MQKKYKKILILSCFFPPSTMPASSRTYGFAKYLYRYGYKPTIISRKWDDYQNLKDFYSPSNFKNIEYLSCRNFNAYLLPYNPNFRDRLVNKKGFIFTIMRKIISTLSFLLYPFNIRFSPYYPIYFFANELLYKEKYDAILATGNPFELFRIAKKISIKHNVPYILDYRDDWSTSELNLNNNFSGKIKRLYFRILEKSWTKKSRFFISVTPNYVSKIKNIINIEGIVIYNGYFTKFYNTTFNEFSFLYSGNLYKQQNLEIVFKAFANFKNNVSKFFKIYFVGNENKVSIDYYINKYSLKNNVIIINKQPMAKTHLYLAKSYGYLLFPYSNLKGILTTKLFEYLSYQKPILLCPSDKDVMEDILLKTQTGLIANTVDECYNMLIYLFNQYQTGQPAINPNINEIVKYSRKAQTKRLAEILDQKL